MYCLLAILLLTGDRKKYNDRLAIMKFEKSSKFYRIYRPNGMRKLPGIEAGSDVIMATSLTNGPGTYMIVYCTPSQDSSHLRRYITRGIREMEDTSHIGFHQPSSEEIICSNHIRKQLRKRSRNEVISIDKDLDKNVCSTSTIYTLAIQNNFCVQSVNHGALTPTGSNLQKIFSDDLFRMSDLVLGSKFICQGEIDGLQTVMVWYQGYPNIFQEDRRSNLWFQMRNNSQRGYDYHHIIDFIAKHFVEVESIRSALMEDGDTTDLSTNDSRFVKSNSLTRNHYVRDLLISLGQKNLRLVESPAYGFVGNIAQ